MSNLIGNAIKLTPVNEYIKTVVKQENGKVQFLVPDKGTDIPEKPRNFVFISIFNHSTLNTSGKKDSGLEQDIVKKIIDPFSILYFIRKKGKNASYHHTIINQTSNKMKKFTFSLTLLLVMTFSVSLMAQQLNLSKFGGMKFRNIGPAGMSGRVTAIDVNQKDPRIMFVGTASGGVWRSTDRGISWKPVFDKQKIMSIGAIAIDQHNPDIIWVGTGEGDPRNTVSSGVTPGNLWDWKKPGIFTVSSLVRITAMWFMRAS